MESEDTFLHPISGLVSTFQSDKLFLEFDFQGFASHCLCHIWGSAICIQCWRHFPHSHLTGMAICYRSWWHWVPDHWMSSFWNVTSKDLLPIAIIFGLIDVAQKNVDAVLGRRETVCGAVDAAVGRLPEVDPRPCRRPFLRQSACFVGLVHGRRSRPLRRPRGRRPRRRPAALRRALSAAAGVRGAAPPREPADAAEAGCRGAAAVDEAAVRRRLQNRSRTRSAGRPAGEHPPRPRSTRPVAGPPLQARARRRGRARRAARGGPGRRRASRINDVGPFRGLR